VGFEVIWDNFRRILAISCIQYGSRNEKHVVKLDENVDPNGCAPKPRNSYYLWVKLFLGTQPRRIDFCCYIWGQQNYV
jgi:hypothetical protein